jgi:hypothetical protein
MEQFGLVVPVLPGRTADARDFMQELEADRNADYRRSVFVSTVWQRPLPVCSHALGLSLRGWLGRGLRPAVNRRCPGKPLAREHMGAAGVRLAGPMAHLAADGPGEAPAIGAEMGRGPWPRRTIPNGEVGYAEGW